MSAISRLATFVATAPRSYGEDAVERSVRALIDTAGCMFAGAGRPAAVSALAACQAWGSGTAPVVAGAACLPPPFAALVNGAAAHALDYDDYDVPTNAHPSAVIFPALLAVAEPSRHSGRDLLDAHIVGVEVMQRLGEAMNMEHYRRGWHTTVTLGGLGATAACARLRGLSEDTAACALSLAASMASGLTNQSGFTAKQLHAGLAAKNAVLATQLAHAGVRGSDQTVDGPVSLASVMGAHDPGRFAHALTRLGQPWSIMEHGLIIKPYPSCGYTHRVIDAALALRERPDFTLDEIESIEIGVPDFFLDLLVYDVPATSDQAMFSAQYAVAAALQDGRFDLASLQPARIERAAVQRLCARASVVTRAPRHGDVPFSPDDPDSVTLRLRGGASLAAQAALPLGAPDKPLDDDALAAKFHECAGGHLSADDTERRLAQLREAGHAPDLTGVLNAIAARAHAPEATTRYSGT